MDLATEVYMNRVNGCSCGETRIQLFRGANSTVDQERRTHLLQYLKGSLKQKQKLRVLQPDLYAHFERISDIKFTSFCQKHTYTVPVLSCVLHEKLLSSSL